MSRVRGAALWLLAALCVWGSFQTSARIALRYPGLSLRYDDPVDARSVRQALEDAPEEPTPAFWAEQNGAVQTEFRESEALCIGVSGDASRVWPERFLKGGWFGPMAERMCAVSRQTALELFGSLDCIGQTLTLDAEAYTVSGVFNGKESVVVYSAPEGAEFSAIELPGEGENPRADALAFAEAAGLTEPDDIVYGRAMAKMARAAAWIPLALASLPLFAAVWRALRRRIPRSVCFFALAFAAAMILPLVLNAVPGWLVPAQWSDFSFWPSLVEAAAERCTEWFRLAPSSRDVEMKCLLIAQAVFCIVSTAAVLRRRAGKSS